MPEYLFGEEEGDNKTSPDGETEGGKEALLTDVERANAKD